MRPPPPAARVAGAFALVMALACPGSTEVDPGASFQLRVGDRATVNGTALAIRFVAVTQDSRCPRGAVCVWAGDATVQLDAVTATDSTRITLHSNPGAGDPRAAADGHTVELLSLTPAPVVGERIPPGRYVATLRVTS